MYTLPPPPPVQNIFVYMTLLKFFLTRNHFAALYIPILSLSQTSTHTSQMLLRAKSRAQLYTTTPESKLPSPSLQEYFFTSGSFHTELVLPTYSETSCFSAMGSLQMNNKYKLFFAVSNASNDAFMVTTEMPKLKNCLACDISYGSRGRSRTFKMTKDWGGGGTGGQKKR